MSETTERKTVLVLGEKITRVNVIDGGNAVEIYSISDCIEHHNETDESDSKVMEEYLKKYFPVVKASTLSLKDEFMQHKPETKMQRKLKRMLNDAIKSGLVDFRAQRMDPSLDDIEHICYKAGEKPAVGKYASWWYEEAKVFMPEKDSRLGNQKERVAFLGILIKSLIEEQGYTVSEAWKSICDHSDKLGHYWDSEDGKKGSLEPTGSRQVGEWYDLANVKKIIFDVTDGGFLHAGGGYYNKGGRNFPSDDHVAPLAVVDAYCSPDSTANPGVGWIVLSV